MSDIKDEGLLRLNAAFDEALEKAGDLFAKTVERLVRQRNEALKTLDRIDAHLKEWEL
jgi:hypothetical protein